MTMKIVPIASGERRRLRLSASWQTLGALLLLGMSGTALAQESTGAETERSGLEEIVVTATKVATNVQDTPISITAVTSETLEQRGLTTTAELGKIIPNARFEKAEGVYGPAVTTFLRGLGQGDPQFSGEAAVAYYIDDIYYPFLFGAQFDLLDLERVEVLRGPQGTLFGRNSIGGAVSMVSRKPSLEDAHASLDVTVGSYQRRDVRAGFSVPLTDTLAVGATFLSKKRQGYQEVLDFSCQMFLNGTPELAGKYPFRTEATTWTDMTHPTSCVMGHLGGEDTRAVRGSLYWEPAPNIEVSLSADYMDQNDESAAEHVFEVDYRLTYGLMPDGTVNEALANRNFITAFDQFSIPGHPFRWDERFETQPYQTYDDFCDPFPAGTLIPGNTYYNGSVFRGGKCYGQKVSLKNRGVQAKVIVGLTDQIDFTAIAGIRKMDMAFGAASDGTPLSDSIIYHSYDEQHWTGELRLTGRHDLLDWVGGVFYYDGSAKHIGHPQGVQAGTQRFQDDIYEPRSWAAYGNAVVHVFDKLNVTLGGRYSDDRKRVDYNNISDGTPPGQTVFQPGGVSTVFDIMIATKRWDWKAGLDYKPNDNLMVYAAAGSGYRLPGFNVRPSQPGQEGQTPGEALISYELGVKSELFDRRLRLNAAAFYMTFTERPGGFAGQEAQLTTDLKGFVAGNRTVIPDGPQGTSYANAFTNCRAYDAAIDGPRNTAAGIGVNCVARSFSYLRGGVLKGFESEIEAEPIDNLRLTGSVGFTRWVSDSKLGPNPTSAAIRSNRTSSWTASGGIQYKIAADVLGGSFTPRLDWFFVGPTNGPATKPQYDQPSVSTFNGRITYQNMAYNFDIAVGATNLFNKFYYRNRFLRIENGNTGNLGQPSPPREFYLTFKKRF